MKTDTNISRLFLTAILAFILLISACKLSDDGATPHLTPDRFLASVTFEHQAINLSTVSPYDTITLRTVALMADSSASNAELIYTVNSPAISISNGVLTAHSAVSRAMVTVKVTDGSVTRMDTAYVSVITTAPPNLDHFTYSLDESDSAKVALGLGVTKSIDFIAGDDDANLVNSLQVEFKSSDTRVAGIVQSGPIINVVPVRPGRVVLTASAFAYGQHLTDSLEFIVGWPLLFHMPTTERYKSGSTEKNIDFLYRDITIGVGGCVVWTNRSQVMDVDVQFDNQDNVVAPTACTFFLIRDKLTGGNIGGYRAVANDGTDEGYLESVFSPYRARTFSADGMYPYRSLIHGTGGVIRVCNENSDSVCAPKSLGAWQ